MPSKPVFMRPLQESPRRNALKASVYAAPTRKRLDHRTPMGGVVVPPIGKNPKTPKRHPKKTPQKDTPKRHPKKTPQKDTPKSKIPLM